MEVILGLFVLWTWPFWVACGIVFILLFATVEQYTKTDETLKGQMGTPVTILLILIVLCIWANNPRNIWLYIQEHWISLSLYVLGYLIIGSLWSFNRWRMVINKAVERYIDYSIKFIESKNSGGRRSINDFKPRVEQWKVSIISWIIFWPVSMLRYLFGSFIIDMLEGIFNRLKGIYQKMNDSKFDKVSSYEAQMDQSIQLRRIEEEELKNKTNK